MDKLIKTLNKFRVNGPNSDKRKFNMSDTIKSKRKISQLSFIPNQLFFFKIKILF
jgi:hypothetical protein